MERKSHWVCDAIKGCPADKAWAILKGGRIVRITFSKALAEHAIECAGGWVEFQLARVSLKLGDEVPKGKKAKTGLYAILDRRKDTILRVALQKEIAEYLCDYQSRYVREAFISRVEPVPVPGIQLGGGEAEIAPTGLAPEM